MEKFQFIHSLLPTTLPFSAGTNYPSSTIITLAAVAVSFVLLFLISTSAGKKKKKTDLPSPPEADGAWPVIGHLHLFRRRKPAHRILGPMADKYGPIFTIRMGRAHQRAIVVSNWETAKECLTTNDKAFIVNRPQTIATEIMGYDGAVFGFSPYGDYWREIRKLLTSKVLSVTQIRSLGPVFGSEVRVAVKVLHGLYQQHNHDSKEPSNSHHSGPANPVPVDMSRWFDDVALNIILKIVYGETVGYFSDGRVRELVKDYMGWLVKFGVGDVFPGLRWLDIEGHEKGLKKTAEEFDNMVQQWLNKHKQKRGGGDDGDLQQRQAFMGVLLDVLDDTYNGKEETRLVFEGRESDAVNKATCLTLTVATADTTTVTMIWALSLLMNHPQALKKAQLELDHVVGTQRQVQEFDIHNLHYLKAIVKETLRLIPAGPLILRGESGEACFVSGYHVPKGTQLIINTHKVQTDPRLWNEPNDFLPERFLTTHKDVEVRGLDYGMLPFGSGRRMCVGISFALEVMHLTLATLLHGFDFVTSPLGKPVDMTEVSLGVVIRKAIPLEILLSPRLPAHLYE